MAHFEVDMSYKIEEYETITVEADDRDQAEDFARENFVEMYTNVPVTDVNVDDIKEIIR